MSTLVDVVVVAYNSRAHLRACVEPLAGHEEIEVTVVDNASSDGCLAQLAGLELRAIALGHNGGFGHGCNVGARAGAAPFVLFLNPDARIDEGSVRRLAAVLESDSRLAAAAPRIVDELGALERSQRRFPRLRSTFAQALFLHRLVPSWDELVREERSYAAPARPDWASGACVLVRRSAFEAAGGFDEGFFHYYEDVDLCRRLDGVVCFEPAAIAVHSGGGSAPRAPLLPRLTASKIRYVRKHASRPVVALERLGLVLHGLTHALVARRHDLRAGQLAAVRVALFGLPEPVTAPAAEAPRSYAVVTPARDEAENLPRLAACLVAQTVRPSAWIVVDNGSTDATPGLLFALARGHPWIHVVDAPGGELKRPGEAIVRAFHRGLEALAAHGEADVVVNLDADTSFEPDYFERQLSAFADDPSLGITGGACFEQEDGAWRPVHVTRQQVRGASHAFRRECLEAVLPLEPRLGWDGIAQVRANARGWTTRALPDLPFKHHRRLGERDGARYRRWSANGRDSHFMGYRFWYLVLRAVHHARRDPFAFALVLGYLRAAMNREPRLADPAARAVLRREQGMLRLARRRREVHGRSA
jgi:GT2 family glycosyltransferase